MLKMFQAERDAADSPEFWEQAWSANPLPSALDDPAVCENDPLFPLFVRALDRERLFLEGGCGQAQWVKYFADRGQRSVGIDFAARTIDAIKRRHPTLDVRVGNILDLPLADGAVHTYYSGGVVEHFEGGPEQALSEARRVIADDGWFLCSVPDQSTLRDRLFRKIDVERPDLDPPLRVFRVDETRQEAPPQRMRFYQYAFTEAEFRQRLSNAGFEVAETFGYGVTWGLFEVRGIAAIHAALYDVARRLRGGRAAAATRDDRVHEAAVPGPAAPAGLLQRVILREDPTVPLLGPVVRAARQHCASMRMFVARSRR
jgi:SAM-dependent methyltransferase